MLIHASYWPFWLCLLWAVLRPELWARFIIVICWLVFSSDDMTLSGWLGIKYQISLSLVFENNGKALWSCADRTVSLTSRGVVFFACLSGRSYLSHHKNLFRGKFLAVLHSKNRILYCTVLANTHPELCIFAVSTYQKKATQFFDFLSCFYWIIFYVMISSLLFFFFLGGGVLLSVLLLLLLLVSFVLFHFVFIYCPMFILFLFFH